MFSKLTCSTILTSEGWIYMKNKICIILLFCLFFWLVPQSVKASEAGYYYQNMRVDVEVNAKREYKIVEYLDVYFDEEMHGIIRSIPTYSSVEKYSIEDINLVGADYEVDYGYNVDIKIGSPDKTVTGLQHYELSYTLKHYQDYDDFHDYVYVNVLGNDYDTYIEHFESTLTFEPDMQIDEYKVTSGQYSAMTNQYIEANKENNKITMMNNQIIPSYHAATIQVQLPQGTFHEAPEYVYPYVINDAKIDMTITDTFEYFIQQDYAVTPAYDTSMYVDFDIDESYNNSTYKDVEVTANCEYYVGDNYASFYLKQGSSCSLSVAYKMRPKSMKAETEYYFVTGYDDTKVEKLEINLNAPIIPDYRLTYNRAGDNVNKERFEIQETPTTWHLQSKGAVQAAEQVRLDMYFPAETFHRPLDLQYMICFIVAVGLGISAIILKFTMSSKRNLIAPILFYPPDDLNSAEVGYIYDDVCSNEDITSLLFLWASKGYMKIHQVSKKTYNFERLQDITLGTVPEYEHQLFNATFSHGEGNVVDKNDLKYSYYKDVNRAIKAVKKKYSGDCALYSKSILALKIVLALISIGLFIYMIAYARSYKYGYMAGAIIGLIENSFAIISMTMLYLTLKKLKDSNWFVKGLMVLIYGIFVALSMWINAMYLDGYKVVVIGTMILLIFDFILFLNLRKFSAYGAEMKGKVLGFKEFLVRAEKEQLEALLADNPEYYYHILPYAQSLGVTKIWQRKFKDIVLVPPSYYDGNDVSFVAFNRMVNGVTRSYRSASVAPSSSSSGGSSGFSGGGGGFSGGGSSGGGSGGGGSRGW